MFKRKKKEVEAIAAGIEIVKAKGLEPDAVVLGTVDVPPPMTAEEPEEVDVTGAIKAITSFRDRDGFYYVKLIHIKDKEILRVDELYKTRDKRSAREKLRIETVKKGVMVK